MANNVKKTTPKKTVEKKTATKKTVVEKPKAVKKAVEKKEPVKKATSKKFKIENKMKSSKFTLFLTIVGIMACVACAVLDGLSSYYNNMPLYAILLLIIIIEDKK